MRERDNNGGMNYTGSCHCGAIRFRFESDTITSGVRCNCSICVRKGTVMSARYLELDEVIGEDNLSLYQWGDKMVNHYFCKICGIVPFHDSPVKPGRRVNLGCVDGVDTFTLAIELIDGKSL